MAMTPTKRTQEEHNELIKKVVQMRAQGVTFTGIAEALCEKYNVNTKDVQNIYYRQQAKQQTEQVESKQEENDTEALGSVIASGIEHATDHESNELPEIILWRSSKTRKTMIRCESDGVKIKIDVTDPKVLKGVMDELAMMLNAAVWGV